MQQYPGVRAETLKQSLLKMGQSAVLSPPIHFLTYWCLVLRVPFMWDDPVTWRFFALLVFNTLFRVVVWRIGPSLIERPNGQTLYRWGVGISGAMSACIWGGVSGYSLWKYGVGAETILIFAGMIGTCTTVLPIASLDLLIGIPYLFICNGLTIAGIVPHLDTAVGRTVLFSDLLLLFFLTLLTRNFNRNQVQLLQSYEKVRTQESLIRRMLESIDQVFLLIGPDGRIQSTQSERTRQLLGLNPSDKHLHDILPPNSSGDRDELQAWIDLLFLDRLPFSELAEHGPKQAEIAATDSVLRLKFHPMRTDTGEMQAVIFIASDISKEVKAEEDARQAHERAEMIHRLVANRDSFPTFVSEFHRLTKRLEHWNGEDVRDIQRELHTLKGGAMILGLNALAQTIYTSEIEIRQSLYRQDKLPDLVQQQGVGLAWHFEEWRQQNAELLNQLGVERDVIEVPRAALQTLRERFLRDPIKLHLFDELITTVETREVSELLREYEAHVRTTAAKLKKSAKLDIAPPASPIIVPHDFHRETIRSLVHLFNNALDHGLEPADERLAAGKPATGRIRVTYEVFKQQPGAWLRLRIEDDGRGIDVAKLRAKLLAQGLNQAAGDSDLEIANHIFDGALSTRDTVTAISGQGVGMGAVHMAVRAAGGQIRVCQTGSKGTTFELLLPMPANTKFKVA